MWDREMAVVRSAHRGRGLLMGAALLSLVTGCTSAGSPALTTSARPTASAAVSKSAPVSLGEVRLVTVTPFNLGSIPVFGAKQLGTWKDSGVTVKVIVATSPTADPLLATGGGDIVDESPNKPVADITKGLAATVVAADSLCWGQVVIASSKEGIKSISDLKGKAFGVSGFGSGGYFATLKVAQHFGWSTDQYKITQLGGLPQLVAALKSGAIDAFIWNDGEGANLQAQGIAVVLGSVNPYVKAAGDVFVVSNSFLKSHAAAIKAFFTGLFAEQAKLKAQPEIGRDLAVKDFKQDPQATESVYKEVMGCMSTDGAIPSENLQGIADAAKLSNKDLAAVDMTKIYRYWRDLP